MKKEKIAKRIVLKSIIIVILYLIIENILSSILSFFYNPFICLFATVILTAYLGLVVCGLNKYTTIAKTLLISIILLVILTVIYVCPNMSQKLKVGSIVLFAIILEFVYWSSGKDTQKLKSCED